MNNNLYLGKVLEKGHLKNKYQAFKNLVGKNKLLGKFTTKNLNFDLEHPVDIIPQESYDGAINLIINDDKNPPRLINSRFSVQNDTDYLIPEHYGFKDTNVYDDTTFDVDTRLKAVYHNIPKLTFSGLENNAGKLPCGSYTFHFKLADVDGNESEICQESGIVQVHIGNDTTSSRMGMENESSGKSVKFVLTNIDQGFDYIRVIFSRISSGQDQAKAVTFHKVMYDYPVVNGTCTVTITGYESIIGISQDEFYLNYADIASVKTQTVSNNVLLFGNTTQAERDWEAIKQMTWRIIPFQDNKIRPNQCGSLNSETYEDNRYSNTIKAGNYYNAKNIYESVGYWPDEIYRLGIVYIFDDNSLSPVFNLQGINFQKLENTPYFTNSNTRNPEYIKHFFNEDGSCRDYEPGNSENELDGNPDYQDNSFFFDKEYLTNSKGVIKTKKDDAFKYTGANLESSPKSLFFDFKYIPYRYYTDDGYEDASCKTAEAMFKKHHIMGFFFVRQRRVPTIIAQGIVVGLTDRFRGSLPVIKYANRFQVQSFLSPSRLLRDKGTFVNIDNDAVSNKALLVPDAEMMEPMFNDLFVSNDYWLQPVGKLEFGGLGPDYIQARKYQAVETEGAISKLTNVTEDTESTTNGTDYFSTRAGNASEAYKTKDVRNAWRWSLPQNLTESTTLVRGLWGSFVGMSNSQFTYGTVVNIKKAHYQFDNADELEFRARFTDLNPYHAITHWTNISDLKGDIIECYRGDCFTTLFTHRMYRNFIDPELPTNRDIIDPSCWRTNYGVRCTAEILLHAHSNLTKDSEGWFISDPTKTPPIDWATFAVLIATGNLIGALVSLKNLGRTDDQLNTIAGVDITSTSSEDLSPAYKIEDQEELEKDDEELKAKMPEWARKYYPNGMANEVVQSFETHLSQKDKRTGSALKKKVNPREQEQQGGLNLKAIFHSDDSWELHGLANINRADVNAVGLGQWITFPICSNNNYSFRDIDFSNATEEAAFHKKRSFYPLQKINQHNPLRDSNVINYGARVSVPEKNYFIFPSVPFIKQEYFTRVYNSLRDSASSFTNEYKQIFNTAYRDYDKQYGAITKLVAIPNGIVVVFSHGVGLISITNEVDFQNFQSPIMMISTDYGSMWKDSVMVTSRGVSGDYSVYGVDHVAKKIWRYSAKGFELLSDHKVGKFLIDNIDMTEFTNKGYIGHINIKTHYNAFKHDVIFTYYNDIPYQLYEKDSDNTIIFDSNRQAYWNGRLRDDPTDLVAQWKIDNCKLNQPEPLYENEKILVKLLGKDILARYYTNRRGEGDEDFNQYAENRRKLIDKWESGKHWSLCYNEDTTMFTTFYDWYPVESANIDNVFFSFDRDKINTIEDQNRKGTSKEKAELWKHGQSGLYELTEPIKPTNWYGTQHEFNFEFVVNKSAQMQKIFNNLKMISNKVEPMKFEFEVVGEGYDWYEFKAVLGWIQNHSTEETRLDMFREVLSKTYGELKLEYSDFPTLFDRDNNYKIQKLPYLKVKEFELPGIHYSERYRNQDNNYPGDVTYFGLPTNREQVNPRDREYTGSEVEKYKDSYRENSSITMLIHDEQLNEYRVRTEQLGNNIKKFGRLRGNMQYLEDLWDVEIRPISFKWIYLNSNNELAWSKPTEMRLRDKYMKVKVRYTGKDLTVIQAIQTMFDFSFA